jgi:hypothetical protein
MQRKQKSKLISHINYSEISDKNAENIHWNHEKSQIIQN